MYSFPEQFSALSKANVDSFVALAGITSASAERFVDFHTKAAKAAFEDAVKNVRALATFKEPQEFLHFGTAAVQPGAEKAATYARQLFTIASETQSEFTRFVDEHVTEFNRKVVAFLDDAAKTGPAGSDVAVAAAKSAVAAANQAYDVFTKAGRQFAEVTETTVQAVASAGVRAANSATPAGKKKAA
jgi:phasin family protein